jgi:hypothetical protein
MTVSGLTMMRADCRSGEGGKGRAVERVLSGGDRFGNAVLAARVYPNRSPMPFEPDQKKNFPAI